MTQGGTKAKPWPHQKGAMARLWACLRHLEGTLARTHGLLDICGVHLKATTTQDLVRTTSSLH